MKKRVKIGLALGSGAARGWAHIGVLKALEGANIRPDIIAGSSIGAVVGAAYAAGNMPALEHALLKLTRLQTARYFSINSGFTGFINQQRLHTFLSQYVATQALQIEDLPVKYANVATQLHTGREVWHTTGPLLDSVWASIAVPGLFPAVNIDNHWLVDGGLVNPVPISVCRALGADAVIAVNLNGDILGKHVHADLQHIQPAEPSTEHPNLFNKFTEYVDQQKQRLFASGHDKPQPPALFDTLAASINIAQDRITRSRMAGDPPDVLIQPRLSHIGLLEFYRAHEAIEAGYACVEKSLPEIEMLMRCG